MAHWSIRRPQAVLPAQLAPPSDAVRQALAVPRVVAVVVSLPASALGEAAQAPLRQDAAASTERLARPELVVEPVEQLAEPRQAALPKAPADAAQAVGQPVAAASATPVRPVAQRAPVLDYRPWPERPSEKPGDAEEKPVSAPEVLQARAALTALTALARNSVALEMPLRAAVVAPEAPAAAPRLTVPVELPLAAVRGAAARPEMESQASERCRSSLPVSRAA